MTPTKKDKKDENKKGETNKKNTGPTGQARLDVNMKMARAQSMHAMQL